MVHVRFSVVIVYGLCLKFLYVELLQLDNGNLFYFEEVDVLDCGYERIYDSSLYLFVFLVQTSNSCFQHVFEASLVTDCQGTNL